MADTVLQVVVSPFLGVLFDNLGSLIDKEFGMIWGVPKEMEKLSNTLTTIRNVLEDAEDKQLANQAITNWLRKLKNAAYDADDVLDECAFKGLQLASEMISNSCSKQVTDSFLSCLNFKQMILRHKMGKRIKRLNERFDAIAEERSKFHLTEGTVERRVEFCRGRETSSMFTEPQFYGRDEDIENLVTLLVNDVSSQEDISVCPVLGIGGLGKTTLAQLVYNDERVTQHFEVKLWVCVSDDFDVKRLMKSIIISLSGDACDLEELDHLQRRLQEKLGGKRFLLVLDDVWNESQEEWNKLKFSLTCGAEGSSVIVTTRLQTVASITGTLPAYPLKVLSEDDCWFLFKQRAFGLENEERPGLMAIGKEIVKKCGGVPLAAKALGGLMRLKRVESEWLFVRDSEIWNLPQNDENNILPALKLSYNHLPSHLRQCFAYCAMYPKDHQIRQKELLHLWIANGLVQSKGEMCLEDVANEIFNDLLWRSFFQDTEKDEEGDIFRCKMHDLVHDLACSITLNECSSVEVGRIGFVEKNIRHMSLIPRNFLVSLPRVPPFLRTFLLINGSCSKVPRSAFSDLIYLRALDLSGSAIEEFPILSSNLKHLRYLNLSDTDIRLLPESFCCLRNLQVLKLEDCSRLERLPKHMNKMSSLRHLYISGCDRIIHMPLGMGDLVHLQTLSIFIVGLKNGSHIKELQRLDLGGEVHIKGLELVRNSINAREAKLIEKKDLRSLSLTWSSSHLQEHAEEVIEGLHPHPNTSRLSIRGYGGVIFPNWLGVLSLPKLVDIDLRDCARIENLPSFGQLPLLKVLRMFGMHSLKSISNEFYGDSTVTCFPSLEELIVDDMPELEEWSSLEEKGREIPMFPGLKRLRIDVCPKLSKIPLLLLHNLRCLSVVEISGFGELISFPEGAFGNLTALQCLRIRSCKKLQFLPKELENLASLTELSIKDCEELSCFPEGLPKLTTLSLDNCNGVRSLPFLRRCLLTDLTIKGCTSLMCLSEGLQHQTALKHLYIYNCTELEFSAEDFQQLTSLQTLRLYDLPKLTCLPEVLQHVSTLEALRIYRCPGLKLLPPWLGNLTSLQELRISYCSNVESIPEEMRQLTALQYLTILECSDELKRRCEKDKGEYWPYISHIPKIDITSRRQECRARGWERVRGGLLQLKRTCRNY